MTVRFRFFFRGVVSTSRLSILFWLNKFVWKVLKCLVMLLNMFLDKFLVDMLFLYVIFFIDFFLSDINSVRLSSGLGFGNMLICGLLNCGFCVWNWLMVLCMCILFKILVVLMFLKYGMMLLILFNILFFFFVLASMDGSIFILMLLMFILMKLRCKILLFGFFSKEIFLIELIFCLFFV